jgi:dUTP pyrophosphatase
MSENINYVQVMQPNCHPYPPQEVKMSTTAAAGVFYPYPVTAYNSPNFSIVPMTLELQVKKLHDNAQLPTRANIGDLGYDLYALEDTEIFPGHVTKVRTGIACNFPTGFGGLLRDRSSVATKRHIAVVAGVIDNGYTGEILVAFLNPSDTHHVDLKAGEKIAQMLFYPVYSANVVEVKELNTTQRGENGFGSSGA